MTTLVGFDTIEVRVRKGTYENLDNRAWEDIPAIEFKWGDRISPEDLAKLAAEVPGVWEVRWNWGGNVAGIGQGHYVPGTTQRERYPHLREG